MLLTLKFVLKAFQEPVECSSDAQYYVSQDVIDLAIGAAQGCTKCQNTEDNTQQTWYLYQKDEKSYKICLNQDVCQDTEDYKYLLPDTKECVKLCEMPYVYSSLQSGSSGSSSTSDSADGSGETTSQATSLTCDAKCNFIFDTESKTRICTQNADSCDDGYSLKFVFSSQDTDSQRFECLKKCVDDGYIRINTQDSVCALDCGKNENGDLYVWDTMTDTEGEALCRDPKATQCANNERIVVATAQCISNTTNCLKEYPRLYNNKQCIKSCIEKGQFITAQGDMVCGYQCYAQDRIIASWHYYSNGEKKCLTTVECPTDETYKYLLFDTMQCQEQYCNQFGKMYTQRSEDNQYICDPVDLCSGNNSFYQNEPSDRINVCIEGCNKVWYYLLEWKWEQAQYKTYRICDLENGDTKHCPPEQQNVNQLTKISDSQCVQYCKDGENKEKQIVQSKENNTCVSTCGTTTDGDGKEVPNMKYKYDNDLYCLNKSTCYPNDDGYNYQNGELCQDECHNDYVYQVNSDGEMTYICSDSCVYYYDEIKFKYICTKDNKCDEIGGKNPYIYDEQQRECYPACGDEDEFSVWIYDEKTGLRICQPYENCNNTQYTVYYKDEQRQCIEYTNANEIKCPSDNYLANVTDDDQTVHYHCYVNPCSYSDYYYINVYKEDGHECIESCSGVWYYYQQDSQQYKICDTSRNICPPTKPTVAESDTSYDYLSDLIKIDSNQCVQSCKDQQDNQYFDIKDGVKVCVKSCGAEIKWYIHNNDNECIQDNQCPQNTYLTNAEQQTYECIQCKLTNDVYKFIQDSTCVNECNTLTYPFINENTCVTSCFAQQNKFVQNQYCALDCGEYKWFINSGEKQCLSSNQCQEPQRSVIDSTQCTDNCSVVMIGNTIISSYYNQNNVCQPECNGDYAYPRMITTDENVCDNQCKYINSEPLIAGQKVIQHVCTENHDKCDDSAQFISQFDNQKRLCIESCGTNERSEHYLWKLQSDNKICLQNTQQCPEGQYIKYDDPLTYECVVCTKEQPEYKYIQEQYCVQSCGSEYPYIKANTNNVCAKTCKYDSVLQAGVSNQCVYDCGGNVWVTNVVKGEGQCQAYKSCSELSPSMLTVEGQDKQCTQACQNAVLPSDPTVKYYRQENVCVLECSGDYVYPSVILDNGENVCVKDCTYKSFDGKKMCTMNSPNCDGNDYYLQDSDNKVNQCVSLDEGQCPKYAYVRYYRYDQNKTCLINHCGEEGYYYVGKYDENTHECVTECNKAWYIYYTDNNNELFVSVCDGKEDEEPSCPPQNLINDEYISKLVKIDTQNQCVERCLQSLHLDEFMSVDDDNKCISNCNIKVNYYVQDGFYNNLKCTDQESCPPSDHQQLSKRLQNTCVQNCTYFNAVVSLDNNTLCTTQACTPLIWKYVDGDKQCRLECYKSSEYYVVMGNNEGKCVDAQYACPDGSEQFSYYKNTETKICEQNYCTNKLAYYVNSYSSDSHVCIFNCQDIWYLQQVDENTQVKVCAENAQSCGELEIQDLIKYSVDKQCTKLCSENVIDKFVSADNDNYCIGKCVYRWKMVDNNEKKCQNTDCSENELLLTDTKQCLAAEQCPENYDLQENKICQRDPCTIPRYYYINKYSTKDDEDRSECVVNCLYVWYIYHISESEQVNICDMKADDSSCPPNKPDGDEYNFVNNLKYMTPDYQCLEKCMDNSTFSITRSSVGDDNVCVTKQGCNDKKWFQEDENTRRCSKVEYCEYIQPYNKLQIDNLDEYCTSECSQEVWQYQIDIPLRFNIRTCVDQCGEYDLINTIKIDEYQCVSTSEEICQKQYHLELQYRNTKCQYVQDAKDCSVYEGQQYYDSIYIFEETTTCTPCEQEGYEKKAIDNINYCVQKDDSMSTGAIVGIVIGVIAVVAIVVVIVVVVLRKKQQKKSRSVRNDVELREQ